MKYKYQYCSGLTSVHVFDLEAWCNIFFISHYSNPLSYAHHLFLNGVEIKDLVIPNSVTNIGQFAFVGCSGLTSVTIPNSVTSIESGTFSWCSKIENITSYIQAPFVIDDWVFSTEAYSGATLSIPH